jgi:diaminopimelate decarboxylase
MIAPDPEQLIAIATDVGTPCYVYDQARIEENYRRLAFAFSPSDPSEGHLPPSPLPLGEGRIIHYAVKANGNLSILRILHELGAGFDVVSVGEMRRAMLAGADPAHIVFAGVGKRDDELVAALDAQIGWINVESAQELRVLSDIAQARGVTQRVALRINPNVDPHTHRYLATGKGSSKFGIEAAEAMQLVAHRDDFPGVAINGIHIHIGSMVSEVAPYVDAMNVGLDLIAECRGMGATMTTFDMGGGFGVAYTPDQTTAPIEQIAQAIAPMARAADVHLQIEPGRSIIADAGVLLTRVLYTKHNGGVNYAVVDAAMNDLIRPALYGAKHRVQKLEVRSEKLNTATSDFSLLTHSIVGPVCESGDKLAEDVLLPQLHRGDLLLIHHAGAYGISMASQYNARPRAAEVLFHPPPPSGEGQGVGWRVIRPREDLESLWASEVECLQ